MYGVCKSTRKVTFYIENFQVLSFDISMGLYLFPVKRKSDASLGFCLSFNFFFIFFVWLSLLLHLLYPNCGVNDAKEGFASMKRFEGSIDYGRFHVTKIIPNQKSDDCHLKWSLSSDYTLKSRNFCKQRLYQAISRKLP